VVATIIAENGEIYPKVRVKGHVEKIVKDLTIEFFPNCFKSQCLCGLYMQ